MSGEQVMERRPVAATVLAVLSLVWSSLSLLGTFFRAMALAVIRFARVLVETMPEDTGAAAGLVAGAVDSMVSFSVLVTLVRAAIAGLGLAAGIGLLSRRRWSVSLATAYGGASVGLSLLQYVFVVERARQVTSYVGGAMDGAVASLAASVIALLGAVGFLLGCAFPVVAIVLVNQAKVRRYYLG